MSTAGVDVGESTRSTSARMARVLDKLNAMQGRGVIDLESVFEPILATAQSLLSELEAWGKIPDYVADAKGKITILLASRAAIEFRVAEAEHLVMSIAGNVSYHASTKSPELMIALKEVHSLTRQVRYALAQLARKP